MLVVLCVIIGGIILTTMCMDVVGRMYLKEIHFIGRKIQTNNPFFLIREAKARYMELFHFILFILWLIFHNYSLQFLFVLSLYISAQMIEFHQHFVLTLFNILII